ncbi:MAG TPA: hypothetical protein VEU62_19240 [Bryobacterales bacterium]|nr:hypothetical protein [Bryobacterales bacterium]
MSWQFSPHQKRLSLTLPEVFGGQTYELALTGGYTFTARPAGFRAAETAAA